MKSDSQWGHSQEKDRLKVNSALLELQTTRCIKGTPALQTDTHNPQEDLNQLPDYLGQSSNSHL